MKNEKYDPAITNYSKFNKLFPHAQHNSPTDSPLRKFQFLKKTFKKKPFLHAHAKSEMKYIV